MEGTFRFETISSYNDLNNHKTLHPLVSVIDLSKAKPRSWGGAKTVRIRYDFYCIFLKEVNCGDLKYGRHYYDYQEGTLVFLAPGQVTEIENSGEVYQPMGHALVFHPDLIRGTALAKAIDAYNFFSYQSNEALHLSDRERQIVMDCFSKIEFELQQNVDKHSKKLIASNIELFLNYCERFYDRQFITRDNVNKGILEKFEDLLNGYFSSDNPQLIGLPSVAYFANELHLSANYFGDLIKKETGQSAKEYVQSKIIEVAKNKVFESDKTVNEIAFEMGFKYPQHFTRLFKQRVGHTPNEYRNLN
ncbi:MAG TPA: helix-turn-helix domain-containing protein [Haliscomenobacter sp.]|uniref:helix-turn-helix domain-containing protein n=1 Tax=Haliscomenobacter sp. TaxID=2717303 RepID=UPI002B79BE47|nr:helix-turn-helix domain-containing protein [Haliscomenobacter sp.]HOY20558.1 helix-turn-helix domain-containing protein [Haliscomenobacter sp.]HPH21333.1 helix-turn-helix domain-containing protein [Haliscomenobacter sp.]